MNHKLKIIFSILFVLILQTSCNTPTPTHSKKAPPFKLLNSLWAKGCANLMCTSQSRGKLPKSPTILWKFKTEGKIGASGIIDKEENIYFGSYDSHFYAINKKGELLWKIKLDEWIDSSPAIANNGLIYVGCDDGNFLCISTKEKKVIYKYNLKAEISSSPSISPQGLVLVGSEDGVLYAFSKELKPIFQFTTPERILVSSPLVKNGKIIFGSEDGFLYCINSSGNLLWKYKGDEDVVFNSPPLMDPYENIYFSTPTKYVISLGPNGKERWRLKIHEEVFLPFASDGARIYGIALDGVLFCFNLEGKILWKTWTSQKPTGISIDGNNLVLVSGNKNLICYSPKGEKIWSISGNFTTPATIGKTQAYIGTKNGIICIGSKNSQQN